MAATDVGELVISLAFESGDTKAEMKALVREVGNLDTHLQAVAAEAGHFGKGLDGAKNKAESLTAQLEMQNRVVAQVGKELATANQKLQDAQSRQASYKAKVDATTAAHDKLGAELKDTKAQWDAAKKAMGDNSNEANELGVKVLELEDAYKKSGEEVKKLNGQIKTSGNDVKKAAGDMQYYSGQQDAAKVKAGALKQELDKVNKTIALQSGLLNATALKEYGESLKATAEKQAAVGRAVTLGLTAPVVALATAGVAAFNELDDGLDTIAKKTGATGEELSGMEGAAVDLYTNMAVTMDDAGTTVGEVSIRFKATGEELNNLSSLFLKFAAVDNTEVNAAVDSTARLLEKFNLDSSDAGNLLGMLTAEGQKTGLSMTDLMSTLESNSSVLKELDLNAAQSIELIGQMELAGVETDTAMAGLKKSVTNLTDSGVPLGQALQTVIDSIKNASTETEALTIAQKTFGTKGAAEMAVAIREGRLSVDSLSSSLSGYGDTVSKTYDTIIDSSDRAKISFNKVKNAGRELGENVLDAIAPAFEEAGEKVEDLSEWFENLNPNMQETVLETAAVAAGIGPAITLLSKGNQAIALAAAKLGTFKTALVDAGGGASGLVSALGGALGPLGIAAVAAAAGYGAYKLIDYASGAKAAREALEALNEQAEQWANTQATTIYDTGNDPFARFGLDKADFAGTLDESKDWMSRLTETWSDGKAETSEIVKSYVDEFTSGSDEIREAIKARAKIQEGLGATDPQNAENLKQLDEYDKEVERLLKKRQNGMLSEEDQARLNEVIQLRAQIQLEYTTGESGGYEQIKQGVEAEKARIEAEGGTVGVDLYSDALTAGAQGYQAQVDALNESYRTQYTAVQAISDEDERAAALTALNEQHQLALNKARSEYNGIVSEYAPEAFKSDDVQKAQADMETFA